MDIRDEARDKLRERDSNMEMEMLELFEDITLEDVVATKACVGRVICCKNMPASVVKKILLGVWCRLGYWRMKKCLDGVLGFFFEEEKDYHFVMDIKPWIINGVLLNLKTWPIEGEVSLGEFEVALFWVQFHGLPTRFLSNDNVPILAKKVGNVVKQEEKRTEELVQRGFLRCWIEIWLSHPILAGFFLKADGKPDSWVQFKYEKLPHICFNYGKLAHWEKLCSTQTAMVIPRNRPAVQMYGTWLKSDTGRSNYFNMAGKGTVKSVVEFEDVPKWDFASRNRNNTWRRKKTSASEKSLAADVTVPNKGEG